MNDALRLRLNAINRDFYRLTAAPFDQTRAQPWPGWLRLLDLLAAQGVQARSVLDVGCGNGRFGLLLAQRSPAEGWHYHGLDNSPALLAFARQRLAALPGVTLTLEARDLVENPLTAEADAPGYDLVALFGVLHHIPGAAARRALLRALAARVRPGGALAFAAWRFYEEARWRARVTPWPDDLAAHVEPGDLLLDWRREVRALRYCHHVDDSEHDALVAASGLREVARYRADGEGGQSNCYSLLLRPPVTTAP